MSPSSQNDRDRAAAAFHSAAIRLLRHLRRADAALETGPAQLSALSVLVFGGPHPLGRLASIEGVRPPTMTRIANGLVDAGLARRVADETDARVSVLEATAKGRRLIDRGREQRMALFRHLLASVSDRDVTRLSAAAKIIDRALRE